MTAYFKTKGVVLYHGDCVEVMARLPENSIDAIVTDPPYGLEFMGKDWDKLGATTLVDPADAKGFQDGNGGNTFSRSRVRFGASAKSMQKWHEAWAREALRILKPGGHLLAFGGTRTYHRMACAIEDAGFEIRDSLMWLYGSGFPKSLDISKAIDKAAGVKRKIIREATYKRIENGIDYGRGLHTTKPVSQSKELTEPATDDAKKWQGWGTALKPAFEPIVLARKPVMGSVSANVLKHGTGGLSIDGTRIGTNKRAPASISQQKPNNEVFGKYGIEDGSNSGWDTNIGRWPANVLLDEEAAELLDEQSGMRHSGNFPNERSANTVYGKSSGGNKGPKRIDRGGASRFFYTSKSSRNEREFALGDIEHTRRTDGREKDIDNPRLRTSTRRNDHPTVKPVDLMRWLCRLVTPPNGVVLDPFVGSGSTGRAAFNEGFRFIGIDLDEHYLEIAKRRIPKKLVPADKMAKSNKADDRVRDMRNAGRKGLLDD